MNKSLVKSPDRVPGYIGSDPLRSRCHHRIRHERALLWGWGNLRRKWGGSERRPVKPTDCDAVLNLVEKRGKE